MTRHGAGVFRHLLHVIPEDTRVIQFHGLDVRFALCDIPCVPLDESQESSAEGAWPPCHPCGTCFHQPEGVPGTAMSTSDEDLDKLAAAALAALNRGDEAAAAKLGKIHDTVTKARDEAEKKRP